MSRKFKSLLKFAESIANHRSSMLHGFHPDVIEQARAAVIIAGGRCEAIGRYHENESIPMSWDEYECVKRKRRRMQQNK